MSAAVVADASSRGTADVAVEANSPGPGAHSSLNAVEAVRGDIRVQELAGRDKRVDASPSSFDGRGPTSGPRHGDAGGMDDGGGDMQDFRLGRRLRTTGTEHCFCCK